MRAAVLLALALAAVVNAQTDQAFLVCEPIYVSCSNDPQYVASLKCDDPNEVIIHVDSTYGRDDGTTCPDVRNRLNSMVKTDCSIEAKFMFTSCVGKNACDVKVCNGHFTDPCVGTYKYLEGTFTCGAPSEVPTPEVGVEKAQPCFNRAVQCEAAPPSASMCDDYSTTITCPAGKIINVAEAYYGRRDTGFCPDPLPRGPQVMAFDQCQRDISAKVKAKCQSKGECTIAACNAEYGDPCTGTYKYIWVDYTCEDGTPGDSLPAPMCPTFQGTLYLDLDYNSLDAQSLTNTLNSWASETRDVDDIIEWVYAEGSVAATFTVHTEADRDALLAGAGTTLPAPFEGVVVHGAPITTTTTTPAPCSPGQERDAISAECVPCPVGEFNADVEGTCAPCPAGRAAPNAGSASCEICNAGEESSADRSACIACEAGTFSAVEGAAQCQACPEGTVGSSGADAGSSSCLTCPAGTYADEARANCVACDQGSVSSAGATECTVCNPGTFANTDSCEPCAPGTAQAAAGQTACEVCAAGKIAATAGAAHCVTCPGGTFASEDNTACTACPAGSISDNGQDGCTPCAAGTYATADSLSCEACADGSISAAGQDACEACPAGTAPSADATACEACPENAVSAGGVAQCEACPAGFVANAQRSACTPCPAGSAFDSSSGSCQPCADGRVAANTASITCDACPAGTTSSVDHTSCEACAPGFFAATAGAATCAPCPAGTVSGASADACTACPPGSEPNAAQSACDSCAAGTFSADGAACEVCPPDSRVEENGSACVKTTTTSTTTTSEIIPGWSRCAGKDIFVVEQEQTWEQASAFCASQFGPQATLFQPGDEMEANLIAARLTDLNIARAWIGMREPEGFSGSGINQQTTGGFADDGQGGYVQTPPRTVDAIISSDYFVWGVDMPINTANTPDCVIANRFSKNRVVPCATPYASVCQRPASVRPNAVQDQCVDNTLYMPVWRRCGSFELYLGGSGESGPDDTPRTYSGAKERCAAEGGELLVPGNRNRADFAAYLISTNSLIAQDPRAMVDAMDSAEEVNVYRTPEGTLVEDLDYFTWGVNMPSRSGAAYPPPANGRACVVGNINSKYRVIDCEKPWYYLCARAATGLADECSPQRGGIPSPSSGVLEDYDETDATNATSASAALTGGVIATVLLALLLVVGALMIVKARKAGLAARDRKASAGSDGMSEGLFNPLYAAPPVMVNAMYDVAHGGEAEYCEAIDLNDAELAAFEPSPACSTRDSLVISAHEEPEEMQ